jgi:hypothetical protein
LYKNDTSKHNEFHQKLGRKVSTCGFDLNLLEIKYCQTMSGQFIKPYRQFSELIGDEIGKMYLVYGGDERLNFENVTVLNWKDVDSILGDEGH